MAVRGAGDSGRGAVPGAYVVIMAGGQSTRFWPLGRRKVPKQFLSIASSRSLLQETVRRLVPLVSWRRVLVVTGIAHAAEVRRQLPRLPRDHVLVEPVGRNTAPCIALAAEWIAARVGDALMIVVPADHVIRDAMNLRAALRAASAVADRQAALVLLGVRPTHAETGYGYIEVGTRVRRRRHAALAVRRFHEKPSPAVARRYLQSGRYLWNSGMFVWKASVFRAVLERCLPEVSAGLRGTWSRRPKRRLQTVYRALPSVSVDSGVLQPLSRLDRAGPPLVTLAAAFDWFDVGSWSAMPELWGCDAGGNASVGQVLPIDTTDCVVYAPELLVALVGVKDLIVAHSSGALLVCARRRAQDVRQVTEALGQRGWSRYL